MTDVQPSGFRSGILIRLTQTEDHVPMFAVRRQPWHVFLTVMGILFCDHFTEKGPDMVVKGDNAFDISDVKLCNEHRNLKFWVGSHLVQDCFYLQNTNDVVWNSSSINAKGAKRGFTHSL